MAQVWALLDLFDNVLKEFKPDVIKIDGFIMKLHYKVTFFGLCIASFLSFMVSWFGSQAIRCTVKKEHKDLLKILERFCWLHPTHVMEDNTYWTKQQVEHNLMGIGSENMMWCPQGKEKCGQREVKFYMWTMYFLLFQALCFYFGKFVWSRWEDGALERVCKSLKDEKLNEMTGVDKEKEITKRAESVGMAIYSRSLIGKTNWWAFGYMLCELLLFINIGAQWWLTKTFLGTIKHQAPNTNFDDTLDFANVGSKFIAYHSLNATDRKFIVDPTRVMFPRQTICKMQTFGAGGAVETVNSLCLLPLNVINEKIFIGLWFWLIIITFITLANLVFRGVMVLSQSARVRVLKMEIHESIDEDNKEDNPLKEVCRKHADYLFFQGVLDNIGKQKAIEVIRAFKKDHQS